MTTVRLMEDGILETIKLLDGFTDANVSRGVSREVSSTGNEFYITVFAGPVPSRAVTRTNRFIETVTTFIVEFSHQIQSNEQETYDVFQEKLQTLTDHLDSYPTLNGTADVIHAMVGSLSMAIKYPNDGANWWTQIISLSVREGHSATNAELT